MKEFEHEGIKLSGISKRLFKAGTTEMREGRRGKPGGNKQSGESLQH